MIEPQKDEKTIQEEVKKEAQKGMVSQFIGALSAALPVLAILGISLDWFNQQFIDALNVFLLALVPLAINLFTIWKNHYTGKHAKAQNAILKKKGLK